MKLSFAVDSNRSDPPINLYPVPDQEHGTILRSSPGLIPWHKSSPTNMPVRGLILWDDVLYAAIGNSLYSINTNAVGTLIGNFDSSEGTVLMEAGRNNLAVFAGYKIYVYTPSTGVFGIPSALWFAPSSIASIDNYLIASTRGSDQWAITGTNDFTSWDALDFATAEARPDKMLRVLADHREVFLFGEETVEPWENTGASDFTFGRIQGAMMEVGIGAPYSAAKGDNMVFWLDNFGMVRRAAQYTPQIISTHYLNRRIAGFTSYSDAIGWTQTWRGHTFYYLTFPTANETWVYDAATQIWHQRASYPDQGRYRGQCYCYAYGKHLVGDYANGIIYELSASEYEDNSEAMRRVVQSNSIEQDGKLLPHREFLVELEQGVGIATGQGEDPMLIMRFSDTNGKEWSNERWVSMGKIGEYKARCRYLRIGRSRHRIYEIALTDPVTETIYAAHINPSGR